jgi:hypothetical protein
MKTLQERFEEKIGRSGDCWVWTATTNGGGYGHFGIASGKMKLALSREPVRHLEDCGEIH